MKTNIEEIYTIVDKILPKDTTKAEFFCEVEITLQQIYYYVSLSNGPLKQCYDLVEEGILEEYYLDKGFIEIANLIRKSDFFDPESRNVVTIIVEGGIHKLEVQYYSKEVGLYQITSEWEAKNL